MKQLYHIKDITWDLGDDEDPCQDLPTQVLVKADPVEVAEDDDFFANLLSDEYGWAVLSLFSAPRSKKDWDPRKRLTTLER